MASWEEDAGEEGLLCLELQLLSIAAQKNITILNANFTVSKIHPCTKHF
jgi:hypothetical protein